MNMWVKVYPDSFDGGQKGSGGEPPSFPSELVRAVRNMVKLPSGDRKEDDAAIKLAREFKKDEFEQFQARVVELAKLDARNQTTFVCPSLESDPKAWIKKTFDELTRLYAVGRLLRRRYWRCPDGILSQPQSPTDFPSPNCRRSPASQPRTPATKSSNGVQSPRLDESTARRIVSRRVVSL
jgi:hypothetical protein